MFNPQSFLQSAPTQPGVYRMLDDTGKILYVGKAKNLKKRLTSYFQRQPLEPKTARLVAQVANVELTVTATEVEALLLENTLIKKHKPRYNIIFKDDKSYPYLLLTNQPFPQLRVIRGLKKSLGTHFGPYPSVHAVRQTLETLFKTFRLRQCDDTFFHNRSRPCLQYQIKRCSGPCVGMIDREAYQRDVERVKALLAGKSQQVLRELAEDMEQAAESLQFEKAAALRDQIKALQPLQQQQVVDTQHAIDADVIVARERDQQSCVQVLFVRQGRILGNQTFFPVSAEVQTNSEVLTAFVEQFYANASGHYALPQEVIVSDPILNTDSLSEHWQTESGFSPAWKTQVRGIRQQWLQMAITNTDAALTSRLAHRQRYQGRFEDAARRLGLADIPKRIECFDISHFQGEATVASCVCFDHSGALKTHYRRFTIRDVTAGDDYAAIAQALSRHLERQLKANKPLAELILIDGGKGQLASAQGVVDQLRLSMADHAELAEPVRHSLQTLTLVGIAKGPERKSGLEDLWFSDRSLPLQLPEEASGFQLLREIRDEAHRFAITGHRKQRAHKRQQSILETIPGIGAKRRQAILQHFGGWQELQQATVTELQKVKGVSESLAREIVKKITETSI